MPPKGQSRRRATASKRAKRRQRVPSPAQAPEPDAPSPSMGGICEDTLIEGIYQRMRCDGILGPVSGTPPNVLTQALPAATPLQAPPTAPAAPAVDSSLAGLAQILSGESAFPGEPPSTPQSSAVLSTLSTPLAAHVALKLRETFWAGKAIDMRSSMLPSKLKPCSDCWNRTIQRKPVFLVPVDISLMVFVLVSLVISRIIMQVHFSIPTRSAPCCNASASVTYASPLCTPPAPARNEGAVYGVRCCSVKRRCIQLIPAPASFSASFPSRSGAR